MSSTQQRSPSKGRPQGPAGSPKAVTQVAAPAIPGLRVLLLPLALTGVLASMSLLPRISSNPILERSFWGAAAAVLLFEALLFLRLKATSAGRILVFPPPKKQHWIQAIV